MADPYKSGLGRVIFTKTVAGSPPVVTHIDMCVKNWKFSVDNKSTSSTTTCDFDTTDQVTYEDQVITGRSGSGSFDCFSTVDLSEADTKILLDSGQAGPVYLVISGTRGWQLPSVTIEKIDYDQGGDGLQSFSVSFKTKGKFVRGIIDTITP